MNLSIALVIAIPLVGAAILALVPGYRISAAGNVLAMLATFAAGVSLIFAPKGASDYFILDEVNILFIILNTLVGLTTSVFSASYIGHEIETGKLTPTLVRRDLPGQPRAFGSFADVGATLRALSLAEGNA